MKKINFRNVVLAGVPAFQSNWGIADIINWCLSLMNYIVPLIIGAAVVVFLYGVLMFIIKSSSGNADGRKEAINFMVFGIIGIAVMVSVWGLVAFVTNTFGVSTGFVPQFPNTRTNNGVDSSSDILPSDMLGPTTV